MVIKVLVDEQAWYKREDIPKEIKPYQVWEDYNQWIAINETYSTSNWFGINERLSNLLYYQMSHNKGKIMKK